MEKFFFFDDERSARETPTETRFRPHNRASCTDPSQSQSSRRSPCNRLAELVRESLAMAQPIDAEVAAEQVNERLQNGDPGEPGASTARTVCE